MQQITKLDMSVAILRFQRKSLVTNANVDSILQTGRTARFPVSCGAICVLDLSVHIVSAEAK